MGSDFVARKLEIVRSRVQSALGRPARHFEGGVLRVSVHDEFAKLRTAIIHDGSNSDDISMDDWRWLLPADEIADHPETGASSKRHLVAQLGRLRQVLEDHDVTCLTPEPQPEAFGQVFTRDPCFVVGETLFVSGLTDPWRLAETRGLRDIRTRCQRVIDLSGGAATIEGGDVMVLNSAKRILVGMHRHTNDAGLRAFSDAIADSECEIIRVPHTALHLDCCLGPLPNGEALYDAKRLPEASLAILAGVFDRLTPLDPDEASRHLAANLFWLDDQSVLSSVATAKTNALLRARGFNVIELDFSHVVTLWGGFRCAVCPLERRAA